MNSLPEVASRHCSDTKTPWEVTSSAKLKELRLLAEKKQLLVRKLLKPEDNLWKYYDQSRMGESYLTFSKKIADGKF